MEAVLQLHPVDVLLIKGKAFIMQVYVLVTSVSPARVYRHREGHILFADKGQVNVFSQQFTDSSRCFSKWARLPFLCADNLKLICLYFKVICIDCN